jgi:RNA polymerase sigma-70 factor (ECF subfamily)
MPDALDATAEYSDFELMLGLKSGEPASMEPLWRRHRAPLTHFLYRRVQNVAIAEELAQDVFLKVYRARDGYQPSAHFTTWLYRITLNRAINWVRDNRHQRGARPLESYVATRAAPEATPEQELLREEMRQRVREAVRSLPDRQRRAVFLHKYGELEYTQIAETLGCSVSAVKALLNRAYFTLRQSLADTC